MILVLNMKKISALLLMSCLSMIGYSQTATFSTQGGAGCGGSVTATLALCSGQVLRVYAGGVGGESDIRVGGTAFPAIVVFVGTGGG